MRRNGRAHSVAAGLGLGAVLAASLALTSGVVSGWAVEPIPIGFITPLTGSPALEGAFIAQGVDLAVAEINAAGGVLGRPLELVVADDGSGAQGAQKAFDSLVFQQKVDALISMETSAARNAGLPIVNRGQVPFIYTSFYEGRSCSPWMYVNAWVPEQQVAPKRTRLSLAEFQGTTGQYMEQRSRDLASLPDEDLRQVNDQTKADYQARGLGRIEDAGPRIQAINAFHAREQQQRNTPTQEVPSEAFTQRRTRQQ